MHAGNGHPLGHQSLLRPHIASFGSGSGLYSMQMQAGLQRHVAKPAFAGPQERNLRARSFLQVRAWRIRALCLPMEGKVGGSARPCGARGIRGVPRASSVGMMGWLALAPVPCLR